MSDDPRQAVPDLRTLVGGMDIYLLDQLLRGRIAPGMRIFDGGCGTGRNVRYFLRAGYDVAGIDPDPGCVARVQAEARRIAAPGADRKFRVGHLEQENEASTADVVLCNAVLHFARDTAHFDAMLTGAWRVLAPGGLFFARLASSIGLEAHLEAPATGRHRLPDASERYLVDRASLQEHTRALGAELLDPIKTTNVQDLRCMTTWVLRKP